jgi:hypothetical protein
MPKYKTIYKKFATYVPLDEMHGIQWFALRENYGNETYGDISKKYRFKKAPRLLDIGDAEVRSMIVDTISPMDPKIVGLSDPDEQYSGGVGNRKYHELVKKYFGDSYDGTVIDAKHLVMRGILWKIWKGQVKWCCGTGIRNSCRWFRIFRIVTKAKLLKNNIKKLKKVVRDEVPEIAKVSFLFSLSDKKSFYYI